jgi:hypothetical protein
MALTRSLKKRASYAARRIRSSKTSVPERNRLIRAYAAEFVAESEKIEGADVTSAEILREAERKA